MEQQNRPPGWRPAAATEIVSLDALALVRFGLRAPDDPRIVNTVRVIDALLKTVVPEGEVWRRYNDDGYASMTTALPLTASASGGYGRC